MEEVYIEIRYLVVEGLFGGDRGVLTCYSSIASLVRSFYHLRGLECLINLLPHSLNHLSTRKTYSRGTVLNVNNAKIVDSTGILAYFLTYYGMICRRSALNLKFLYGKNHRTF